jgi:hypothetical protein
MKRNVLPTGGTGFVGRNNKVSLQIADIPFHIFSGKRENTATIFTILGIYKTNHRKEAVLNADYNPFSWG